jgi:hypothetical protein
MRVEHRELLLAVRWIIGVVDIQHDAIRHAVPALAKQIDEAVADLQ